MNSSESPGRKNPISSPDSAKTIAVTTGSASPPAARASISGLSELEEASMQLTGDVSRSTVGGRRGSGDDAMRSVLRTGEDRWRRSARPAPRRRSRSDGAVVVLAG